MAICPNCDETYDGDNETQPCCSCCGFDEPVGGHVKRDDDREDAELAVRHAEHSLGLDHPSLVPLLIHLADHYTCDRDLCYKAIALYERALSIQDNVVGLSQEPHIPILLELSKLYRRADDLSKAEQAYERIIKILNSGSVSNPSILCETLCSCADLYAAQDKVAQAEYLYSLALESSEANSLLGNYDNLLLKGKIAVMLDLQGHFGKADPLYDGIFQVKPDRHSYASFKNILALFQRSFDIRERELGANHIVVFRALKRLAVMRCTWGCDLEEEMGWKEQAVLMYKRLLVMAEHSFGHDHPEVGTILTCLAEVYHSYPLDSWKEYHAQAESLYQRALEIREKSLGFGDVGVAESCFHIFTYYKDSGDEVRARPYYQRFLEILHVDVCNPLSVSDLSVFSDPCKSRAVSIFIHMHEVTDQLFHHGETQCKTAYMCDASGDFGGADKLYILAINSLYREGGDDQCAELYARAVPYFERSAYLRERSPGLDHRVLVRAYQRLASVYKLAGLDNEAELIWRRIVKISGDVYGVDDADAVNACERLVDLYVCRNDHANAVPLLERLLAYYGNNQNSCPNADKEVFCVNRLAEEYLALGDSAKAERLSDAVRESLKNVDQDISLGLI